MTMRLRAVSLLLGLMVLAPSALAQERPNILWLSSEDNGPHLGAYGDRFADTPHLDRLADQGQLYLHAWSNAPVCAPARTAIITGMYPTALGAQHMRSQVLLPDGVPLFPQLLREVGYYATNNAKEDYNVVKPGRVWDESSNEAHYRNRPHGAPFFAVFNLGITHESSICRRSHEAVHDPAGVRVPAYHPDTPEVRQDWAQYYDRIHATRDLGFLPEPEMLARAGDGAPFDLTRDPTRYPFETIYEVAELATRLEDDATDQLVEALGHADAAVRYWGAVGLLARGASAVGAAHAALVRALDDPSPTVRIAAVEALGRFGSPEDADAAVERLLALADVETTDLFTTVMALNALDYLDRRAEGAEEIIRSLPRVREGTRQQYRIYVPQLLDKILADLD